MIEISFLETEYGWHWELKTNLDTTGCPAYLLYGYESDEASAVSTSNLMRQHFSNWFWNSRQEQFQF